MTSETYFKTAEKLIKAGKIEAAIEQYKLALSVNSQPNASVYINLGKALTQLGKLEEAVENYQKALEIEPKNYWGYKKMGDAFTQQGKLTEAVSYYQKAIEINPQKHWGYHSLGDTLCKLEQWEKAQKAYEKAIELQPEIAANIYKNFYKNLGNNYADKGKLEEAIACHQKGINTLKSWTMGGEKNYEFTRDWFTNHSPIWEKHLQEFANLPGVKALEIGSFEGMSTCWLLDNILTHDEASITCIDTFAGNMEHSQFAHEYLTSLEKRFDNNINRTGNGHKVKKMVGKSQDLLPQLIGENYDFIYIDGSHKAPDVLLDALLCWQMLKISGLIIFDDYQWKLYPDAILTPKPGIDAFLALFNDYLEVLHQDYQVIIKKVGEI